MKGNPLLDGTEIRISSLPFSIHNLLTGRLWKKVRWSNEDAWQSWQNGWTAIVSEDRARLAYLGRGSPEGNLLYSAPERVPAKNPEDPPSWGGHRFWLGPQSAWKPVWPPPPDWEYRAAEETIVSGETLEMRMARANLDLPQIYRRYRWNDDGLICEAAWEHSKEPWCAIHILAIPSASWVQAALRRSPELPNGFGLFRIPAVQRIFPLPVPGVKIDGDVARVHYGGRSGKIGVPASPLAYQLHGAALTFSVVDPDREETLGLPDKGLVTQIYVGECVDPFIELEQLSAILPAGRARQCFSVCLCPK